MKNRRLRLLSAMILTLFAPGLGHIYLGFSLEGLAILATAVITTFALSYFAAVGLWAMVSCIALNFLFHVVTLIRLNFLAKDSKHPRLPIQWGAVGAAIVLIIIHVSTENFRRVKVSALRSNSMAPELIDGDHVAIDRSRIPSDMLTNGDLVVVTFPDRPGEFIRKIESAGGGDGAETDAGASGDRGADFVAIATNDSRVPSETIPKSNIVGRVIYLIYSIDPDQYMFRFDRFFKNLEGPRSSKM